MGTPSKKVVWGVDKPVEWLSGPKLLKIESVPSFQNYHRSKSVSPRRRRKVGDQKMKEEEIREVLEDFVAQHTPPLSPDGPLFPNPSPSRRSPLYQCLSSPQQAALDTLQDIDNFDQNKKSPLYQGLSSPRQGPLPNFSSPRQAAFSSPRPGTLSSPRQGPLSPRQGVLSSPRQGPLSPRQAALDILQDIDSFDIQRVRAKGRSPPPLTRPGMKSISGLDSLTNEQKTFLRKAEETYGHNPSPEEIDQIYSNLQKIGLEGRPMPKNAILEWFGHFPESSKRRAAGYFGGGFLGAELGRILGRNELTREFEEYFDSWTEDMFEGFLSDDDENENEEPKENNSSPPKHSTPTLPRKPKKKLLNHQNRMGWLYSSTPNLSKITAPASPPSPEKETLPPHSLPPPLDSSPPPSPSKVNLPLSNENSINSPVDGPISPSSSPIIRPASPSVSYSLSPRSKERKARITERVGTTKMRNIKGEVKERIYEDFLLKASFNIPLVKEGATLFGLLQKIIDGEMAEQNCVLSSLLLLTFPCFTKCVDVVRTLCSLLTPATEVGVARLLKKWQKHFPQDWTLSLYSLLSEQLSLKGEFLFSFPYPSLQRYLKPQKLAPPFSIENSNVMLNSQRFKTSTTKTNKKKNGQYKDVLKESSKKKKWEKWKEEKISEQLFLYYHKMYASIPPRSFLFWISSKDKENECPEIWRMVAQFNRFALRVVQEIVTCVKKQRRVDKIAKFLHIAFLSLNKGNFFVAKAIFCGLGNPAVSRLKATLAELPREAKAHMNKLEECIGIDSDNGQQYRNLLKKSKPPVIPYLGLHFKDMTFLSDGSPTHLGSLPGLPSSSPTSNPKINIKKFISLGKMAAFLTVCGKTRDKDEKKCGETKGAEEEMWEWIGEWGGEGGLSDDEIFWWSKRVEPRDLEVRLGEMIEKERELEEERNKRKAFEERLAGVIKDREALEAEMKKAEKEREVIEGRVREVVREMMDGEKERKYLVSRVEELEHFLEERNQGLKDGEGGDFCRTPPLYPKWSPLPAKETRFQL